MNKTAIIALSVLAVGGLVAAVVLAKKAPVMASTTVTEQKTSNGILGFLPKTLNLSVV